MDASRFDTAGASAAGDRPRLAAPPPYISGARGGGRHWARIDQGIAPQAYVQAVRADPARPGLLYAGTETGVYVSFDDRAHWQALQLNPPPASGRDLAGPANQLIAPPHGRPV